MQNILYDNPNYYSSADKFLGANAISSKPLPYSDPIKTADRFSSNDYEAPPKLDEYEQPHLSNLYDDVKYEPVECLLPTSKSSGSSMMQSSTLPLNEATPPKDEQIYEDPGHIKEEIYEWFKQRNICKLDKNSIRYVQINC